VRKRRPRVRPEKKAAPKILFDGDDL
jgi:hypothetical protein